MESLFKKIGSASMQTTNCSAQKILQVQLQCAKMQLQVMFSLLVLPNAAAVFEKVCDFRITMESDGQFKFTNKTSLYTQVNCHASTCTVL